MFHIPAVRDGNDSARASADALSILRREASGAFDGSGQEDSLPEVSDDRRDYGGHGDSATGDGCPTGASSAIGCTAGGQPRW